MQQLTYLLFLHAQPPIAAMYNYIAKSA